MLGFGGLGLLGSRLVVSVLGFQISVLTFRVEGLGVGGWTC